MQQASVYALSDYDASLIETHQLGKVIRVYRLRQGYIRLFRWFTYFCFIFGGMVLIIVLTLAFISGNHVEEYFSPVLGALFSLIFGGLIWRFGVPLIESERVIVCEKGLLYLKRKIRGYHIDVVRWEDILEIKNIPIGLEYAIIRQRGEPLSLSFAFQNSAELIALIRRYSEAENHEEASQSHFGK